MNHTSLPDWLPMQARLPHRDSLVEIVAAELAEGTRPICLVGPGGIGKTAIAGTVAARGALDVVAVGISGCRTDQDVVLAIGWSIQAEPPGDEAAVGARLRSIGPALVILDDADVPGIRKAWARLSAQAPELHWLLTGVRDPLGEDRPVQDRTVVHVGPLEGSRSGNPLEDQLDPEDPWGILDDLPPRAHALAWLPAGLPGNTPLAGTLLETERAGRQVLRRSAIDALHTRSLVPAGVAARAAAPTLEHVLGLATGAPISSRICWEDALACRWLGDVLADADLAIRATATAARLLAAWGQPSTAQALLQSARRRNPEAHPASIALLDWAEADISMDVGERETSATRHREACARLMAHRRLPMLAAMLRRRAERLAVLGEAHKAAGLYRETRSLSRQLGDLSGIAATLRGAADLAVAQGEMLSAETLYDQADAAPAGPVEVANRRLGQAGLAIARGELERARRLVDAAERTDTGAPVLLGNISRRRAELGLRQGAHDEATAQAQKALGHYSRAGAHAAVGTTHRILGDIAAATGMLSEAARHYRTAIKVQVRTHHLAGLRRTLAHSAALEEESGDSTLAAELHHLAGELASPEAGIGPEKTA